MKKRSVAMVANDFDGRRSDSSQSYEDLLQIYLCIFDYPILKRLGEDKLNYLKFTLRAAFSHLLQGE